MTLKEKVWKTDRACVFMGPMGWTLMYSHVLLGVIERLITEEQAMRAIKLWSKKKNPGVAETD